MPRKQAAGIAALTSFSGLGMGNGRNRLWTQQGFPPKFRQTKSKEVFLSFYNLLQQPLNFCVKVVYTDDNTVNVRMNLRFGDVFFCDLFSRTI